MKIEGGSYGKTSTKKPVDYVEITNKNNMSIKVITYGATLISVKFPDKDGNLDELTLGKPDIQSYEKGHPFFGSTVGRYANRIKNASFRLNEKIYKLPANNGENSLHGGSSGFDKKIWDVFPFKSKNNAGVNFTYISESGESGYPGKVEIKSSYILTENNELFFVYNAISDKDTPINITNHTYWNLSGVGKGNILKHNLQLNSDCYLPVDNFQIPTGEIKKVKGTPFDFTAIKKIGEDIEQVPGGYDHCFTTPNFLHNKSAINSNMCIEEVELLEKTATVTDEDSGRKLELYTSQPGVQLYTANKLSNELGREKTYNKYEGFCLETQNFPDAPNVKAFPDSILHPNDNYLQYTMLRFSHI